MEVPIVDDDMNRETKVHQSDGKALKFASKGRFTWISRGKMDFQRLPRVAEQKANDRRRNEKVERDDDRYQPVIRHFFSELALLT